MRRLRASPGVVLDQRLADREAPPLKRRGPRNYFPAFASSIMVDTQISSLAQNLDGDPWPVKSKEETPSIYIDLSYDEALELLVG